MKKRIFTLSFLFLGLFLNAQEIAKGIVFNDSNKNGILDKKEKGLNNILVSNGIDIVATNEEGEYQIPITEETIVFVIKPSNYQLSILKDQLPQSYYIHKPNGSPSLKYGGSSPTGKLPKSINFGLVPVNESKQFSALVFGDPQAYTLEEIEYFKKGVVDEAKLQKNMQFGISLGDLVGDDLTLHQPYKNAIKEIGIPWYNVMGNHDMDYDAKEDKYSDDTFEQNFGPANYSYNVGDAHFIVLDNILYPDPRDNKGYWGGFRNDQLQFIENDLKFVPKDKLIVLAFHIPLDSFNENNFNAADRKKLFDLLKDYPNTVSLSAHTHIQQQLYYDKKNDWNQKNPHHEYNVGTTSGDWYSGKKDEKGVPVSTMRDGTPKGYAIMNINGNKYDFDYKVVNKPANYQMNVYNTKRVPQNSKSKAMLVVNFFMGQKGDVVEYQINNGDWKKMNYSPSVDYNYLKTIIDFDNDAIEFDGRRPSDAIISSHIWSVRLPAKEAGIFDVNIRAKDKYGKIHTSNTKYEVVK